MNSSEESASHLLNANFETDFDLDTSSGSTLKIRHEGEGNREKITADRIHNTKFSAKLSTVQYGTWKTEQAVLVVFAFHFGFKNEKRDRYTSATITVEFEETRNTKLEKPPIKNPKNDPEVKFFAPVQICGTISKEGVKRQWNFEGRLGYQIPLGPDLGVKPAFNKESTTEKNRRMWITGETDSDDDHRYDNKVTWELKENKVEESGILHDLSTAVVITLPKSPQHLVKVKMSVTPFVALSVNPLRLLQKKDDPILLDRKTPKGPQFGQGMDFSDENFPWASIVNIPTEYQVIILT
jgi:hypothetical protein